MALTGWSTANYLTRAAAVFSTRPLMFSAWVYRTALATAYAMEIGVSGSADNRRSLIKQSNDNPAAFERSTVQTFAGGATAISDQTWQHLAGCFVSNVLREIELDGANLATSTADVTPGAPDITRIGIRADTTQPWDNAGALAEASIWDLTGLTEPDRRSLADKIAAGSSPLALDLQTGQPWGGLLVAYWPLRDDTDLNDATGNGHNLTMVGTLTTFSSHPPVGGAVMRRRRELMSYAALAAPALEAFGRIFTRSKSGLMVPQGA